MRCTFSQERPIHQNGRTVFRKRSVLPWQADLRYGLPLTCTSILGLVPTRRCATLRRVMLVEGPGDASSLGSVRSVSQLGASIDLEAVLTPVRHPRRTVLRFPTACRRQGALKRSGRPESEVRFVDRPRAFRVCVAAFGINACAVRESLAPFVIVGVTLLCSARRIGFETAFTLVFRLRLVRAVLGFVSQPGILVRRMLGRMLLLVTFISPRGNLLHSAVAMSATDPRWQLPHTSAHPGNARAEVCTNMRSLEGFMNIAGAQHDEDARQHQEQDVDEKKSIPGPPIGLGDVRRLQRPVDEQNDDNSLRQHRGVVVASS
mmetsp:Transcript_1584/g.6919  ORF Transcript_1584/g.6919 Transcript_1584/m.6919 type:complete len:318 (-) Transcript_1584:1147-2100(-)|eukprot:scaffold8354_cov267-Pinguiococcus_pyrenoidosus.AAC.1